MSGSPVLAEVVRSGFTESVHRGQLVIICADETVAIELGEVRSPMFPRSANKPAQAVGMLRAGSPLVGADVAMSAGSHMGEPVHLDRVAKILADAGLDASALRCPAAMPEDLALRDAWVRQGRGPEPLVMGCSGKHAAMLATCVANGWDLDTYCLPEHPLQRAMASAVSDLAGEPISELATDGCGTPIFSISLLGLARTFSRLVNAAEGTSQRLVADAMRVYPVLVMGSTGNDTRLMSGVSGLLCKHGAEMVFAAAIPGVGALALKIEDGSWRAGHVVGVAALRKLGIDAPVLDELAEVPVFGGGARVGSVRPAQW